MKKLIFLLFLSTKLFSQSDGVYQPATVTGHGYQANRVKPLLVLHIPNIGDTSSLHDYDTSAQIAIYKGIFYAHYKYWFAIGISPIDTNFNQVIDTTGQNWKRIIFAGQNNKFSSSGYLLYQDTAFKLSIGDNNPANGGSNKLYVKGTVRITGKLKIGSFTLPNTDGSSNQILQTNGSGVVTWQTISTSSTNSNIGSGFRWAIPNTNNIKTVSNGYAVNIDSSSNTNALTLKADTSLLLTKLGAAAIYQPALTFTSPLNNTTNNIYINANGISNSLIRQSAGLSVIGNSTNSTANVTDITAGSDNQILRRSGTAIGFGSIDLSQSNAVGASILPIANGGTGTATPSLVAGTNVTITGSFPNQTVNTSGGGSSSSYKDSAWIYLDSCGGNHFGTGGNYAAFMAAQAKLPARGGYIILGSGDYMLDSLVTFTKSIALLGAGCGTLGAPSSDYNTGVITHTASTSMFKFTKAGSGVSGILFWNDNYTSPTGLTIKVRNYGFNTFNCNFYGFSSATNYDSCAYFNIFHSCFAAQDSDIVIQNTLNPDDGDSRIYGGTVFLSGPNTGKFANIVWRSSGGLNMDMTKLNNSAHGSQYAIYASFDRGFTSNFTVGRTVSIENGFIKGIYLKSNGHFFGNIYIGAQFSSASSHVDVDLNGVQNTVVSSIIVTSGSSDTAIKFTDVSLPFNISGCAISGAGLHHKYLGTTVDANSGVDDIQNYGISLYNSSTSWFNISNAAGYFVVADIANGIERIHLDPNGRLKLGRDAFSSPFLDMYSKTLKVNADTVGVSASGGAQTFFGIGTTSPISSLDVRSPNNSIGNFVASGNGNTGYAGIGMKNSSGNQWYLLVGDNSQNYYQGLENAVGFIDASNGDVVRFIIKPSTGNVGIGIGSPTNTLHVNGDVRISTISSGTPGTDSFLVRNGGVIKSIPATSLPIKYAHTIFTPTTGGTVALVVGQYNIINPAGALLALTVNFPSSPANNDVVYIKFTQNVTTVTYGNGTVVDGITAPTAGGLTVLTYDSGTTSWY